MFKVYTTSRNTYYVTISKYLLEDYSASYCAAMALGIKESSIAHIVRM